MKPHLKKCPELFEAVKFAQLYIEGRLRLKVFEQFMTEMLFEAIRVAAKETLNSIPISSPRVLSSELSKLVIHAPIEMLSQKEGPEAKQRIHLLRLAHAQSFPIFQTFRAVLVVDHLLEVVLLQQRVAGVFKWWQGLWRRAHVRLIVAFKRRLFTITATILVVSN